MIVSLLFVCRDPVCLPHGIVHKIFFSPLYLFLFVGVVDWTKSFLGTPLTQGFSILLCRILWVTSNFRGAAVNSFNVRNKKMLENMIEWFKVLEGHFLLFRITPE